MVSKTNLAIIGLVALILGAGSFGFLRRNGSDTVPSGEAGLVKEITVNPQIAILEKQIGQVQSFIKNTFKAPILTKGLVSGGKQLPCRGPNCLGIFQAKGTVTTFDPFTGRRVAIAGSQQFQNITGSNFAIINERIDFGRNIGMQANDLLSSLKEKLGLLQTTNTV